MIRLKVKETYIDGEEGYSIKCNFKNTNTNEVIYTIAHLIMQVYENDTTYEKDDKIYEDIKKVIDFIEKRDKLK